MICKVKKLTKSARIPTRGSNKAAGYDIYADGYENDATIIEPGKTEVIGTGLALEFPNEYFVGIYPRSGLATKQGLRPANCVGVVDADYRGEIKVALHNDSSEQRIVHGGDRIAQIIFQQYRDVWFLESKDLGKTERSDGGFGSTGSR